MMLIKVLVTRNHNLNQKCPVHGKPTHKAMSQTCLCAINEFLTKTYSTPTGNKPLRSTQRQIRT